MKLRPLDPFLSIICNTHHFIVMNTIPINSRVSFYCTKTGIKQFISILIQILSVSRVSERVGETDMDPFDLPDRRRGEIV